MSLLRSLIEVLLGVVMARLAPHYFSYIITTLILLISWEFLYWLSKHKETSLFLMNFRKKVGVFMSYLIVAILGASLACGYWFAIQKIFPNAEKEVVNNPSTIDKSSPRTPIPQKQPIHDEPTFKEISGPFRVICGDVSEISKSATREKQHCVLNVANTCVISAYIENGKIYADTMLYGNQDLRTVEIKHNAFMVAPPKWDRNFNNDALEIVDENLDPRLQIIYKTNYNVIIYGIFNVGGGVIFLGEHGMIINPSTSKKLPRLFKYPSDRYSGIMLNKSASQEKKMEYNRNKLTDNQLSVAAISLAKKMRTLETNYKQEYSLITNKRRSLTSFTKDDMQKENEESDKIWGKFELEFKNNFLGKAVYLRDELLKRIPTKEQPKKEQYDFLAFDGILSGPSPVSDAANYLEALARKLSPQLTEGK
jgi:hypothetical protein